MKTSQSDYFQQVCLLLAATVALALPPTASAASITWGAATTISGDTDVSTSGTLVYAYNDQNAAATVNTVAFAAGNSSTAFGANVTMSGFSGNVASTFGASGTPWNGLSSSCQTVLNGAAYGSTAAATITLNNLTVGHSYLVQVWVNDSRTAGIGRTEAVTSSGGNSVTLSYNNTGAQGGVGQYTIGTFTASATTQAFTMTGSASSQLNAIQVRDITAFFSGASGTTWDANTTADWSTTSGGPYNKTWTAAGGGSSYFADFEGTAASVSASGTINVGGITFATDGYTLGGSGTLILGSLGGAITTGSGSDTISAILAGTVGLTKYGSGTLTLSGANTYTGGTTISSGTVSIASDGTGASNPLGAYPGSVAAANLTLNGGGLLDNTSTTIAANRGITLGSSGGTLDASSSQNLTVSSIITGTGALTKGSNTGTVTLSAKNTYSGGTTVNAGTLAVGAGGAVGGILGTLTINSGATVNLTVADAMGYNSGAANGVTTANINGGTMNNSSGGNEGYQTTFNLTGGTISSGGGVFQINNPVNSLASSVQSVFSAPLQIRNSALALSAAAGTTSSGIDFLISGIISQYSVGATLTKSGAGTIALTGANTYTGATTISGGILNAGIAQNGTTSGPLGASGNIVFGGGALQFSTASAGWDPSSRIAAGTSASAVKIDVNGKSVTFGTALTSSQSGGLTLSDTTGGGKLTLNAAEAYTGATTVSAGTLLIGSSGSLPSGSAVTVASGATLGGSGTINGTVSVSAGGILAPGGVNTIGTLTLANNSATSLTLNGNTLLFDLPNTGTTCDLINISGVSGTLVLNGANTMVLNAPNGAIPAGTYTLMTYATKTGSGTLTFQNGATTMGNATLAVNSGNVQVTVGSGGLNLGLDTWKGSVSGVWDGGALNWTRNGTASQAYTAGDSVTFDDTASGNFTVSSGSSVSPASVIFNNSVNAYTISATLGGTGLLVKQGASATTLSGASTFSGGTTLSAGQLNINNGGSSSANSAIGTGALTINGGTIDNTSAADVTLQPAIAQNWNGDFTYAGSVHNLNLGTGAVTPSANRQVTVNGNTLTVGGAIGGGAVGLTKVGVGTLALTGANTYSGATAISAGTLQYTGSGGNSGNGSYTVSGGAALSLNTSGEVKGSTLSFSGNTANTSATLQSGTLTLSASANTVTSGGANNALKFNGGTLKSAGAISIGGSLQILILAGGGTVDTTGGSITSSSGFGYTGSTGTGTFTIQGGNTLKADFTSGSPWTGPVVVTGNSTLQNNSGSYAISGALNVGSGSTYDLNNSSASFGGLTGGGTIVNTGGATSAKTLTITGSGGNTFSGSINPATGNTAYTAVTVNLTSGTQTFSGVNTYSGATTLTGGTLQLQNASAIPGASAFTMNSGTTLQLRANSGTTFAPASVNESGNGTFTFDVNNNGSGSGQTLILANLGQFGPGSTTPTFNLTGGNNYTLQLGSGSAGTGGLNIWNNTTINSSTAGVTLSIPGGINDNYPLNYTLAFGGAGNIRLGALTRNSDGNHGFTPTFGGSGTITLSGANNFAATTGTISTTGTLALNNAAALTGLSSLTISGAATIDNISGSTITFGGNPTQNWNSDFTFGTASTTGGLNLGTGAVTPNASRQITVYANTLTVGGAVGGGAINLTKAGAGTLVLSGVNTYSGNTTISAGTLAIGGTGQLGSGNYAGNIANSGTLVYNSSAAQILSGQISGGGALTQQGAGTLTLAPSSGNNSYSGLTTVNSGTLVVQSSQTGTGNFTVADGADLTVTFSGSSQLQPATLTLGSTTGATLEFNGVNSMTVAPISATTIASGGTLVIKVNSGTFTANGTYPLLTWTSGSAPATSLNAVSLLAIGVVGHLVTNTSPNAINLVIDSVSDIWTGVSSGNWDTTVTGNWTGHATIYSDGDAVLFDDTATGTTNVTVNQVVQPGGVVVNTSAKNYTITSTAGKFIGGSSSLIKAGSGTLTLSGGVNTNTGPATINGGTLSVSTLANGGSASDLGSSANSAANLTLNGGTLQYTGAAATSDRLFAIGTSGATLDASGTGALNLNNSGSAGLSGSGVRLLTLTGTNTAANALAAVIGDNGGATSLAKSGAGDWTLSGGNTYSGATTLSAGTLALSGSGTLGNGTSPLTGSGGILDLGGLTSPTVGAVAISGGTITNGTLTGSSYAGQGGMVSAILAGSGVALTKTTSGILTLSGANTYSGVTTVSAGTLQLQNPSAIASSALQYASGSTLNLRSDTNATFLTTGVTAAANNNPFVWNLDVNNVNAGNLNTTLILQNVGQLMGAYAYTMTTLNVSGGNGYTLQMGGGAAGTGAMNFWNNITVNSTTTGVTLSMPGGLSVNAGFSYSLTLGGAGNISVGPLTRYPGNNLTPTFGGSGNITLNGANNFGAAAGTISTTGTLALNNNGSLTGLSTLAINSAVTLDNTSGGTVTISAAPAQTWSSDFTFGTANTTGALNLGAGTVTLGATRTVTVANSGYGLAVGGVISGSSYGLTKAGPGTLTLLGANTYSGATTLSTGALALSDPNAVQNSALTLNSGTALQLRNNSAVSFNSSGAVLVSGVDTNVNVDVNNNGTGSGNALTLANGLNYSYNLTSGSTHTETINVTGNNAYVLTVPTVVIKNLATASSGHRHLQLDFNPTSANVSLGNVTGYPDTSASDINSELVLDGTTAGNQVTGVIAKNGTSGGAFNVYKNGSGTWTLSGANTYDGATAISAGTLALSGTGSLTSPTITVAGGATFDVSGLSSPFTLGSSQTLANNGTNAANLVGNINTGSGTNSLTFASGTPAFNIAGGTLTLSGATVFKVNNTGAAFGAGSYKLLGTLPGGAVSGTVPGVVVTGGGTTANASLQIVGGELYLVVGATTLNLVSSPLLTNGYLDTVTFAASVQTNGVMAGNATGTVQFETNGAPFGGPVGLTAGSVSTSLNTLPRGTNLITAFYSGDGNYLPSTNSLNQIVTNHPPMAAVMTVTRTAGLSLRLSLSDLATNWSDADGDAVALTGINLATTNGVNLLTNSLWILYTNGPNVGDQFSYSLADGYGGTNIGYVNLLIQSNVSGTNSITGIVNGNPTTVTSFGIPGFNYTLQRATNLVGPVWVDVATNAAAASGEIDTTDYFGDLGSNQPPSAYYRLKWQP